MEWINLGRNGDQTSGSNFKEGSKRKLKRNIFVELTASRQYEENVKWI